ncbi:MAG: hypothetical protein WDN69_21520 [Aliidongia sp.]
MPMTSLRRQPMRIRQHDVVSLIQQWREQQPGPLLGISGTEDPEIEHTPLQRLGLCCRRAFGQDQFDIRMPRAEAVQQSRQHAGKGDGTAIADFYRPERRPPRSLSDLLRMPRLIERQPRLLKEQRAGGSQRDGAFAALQQTNTQFLFQRLDLHAQSRLGNVQAIRCAGEMQGLGDGDEVVELPQLDHTTFLQESHRNVCFARRSMLERLIPAGNLGVLAILGRSRSARSVECRSRCETVKLDRPMALGDCTDIGGS